jgi:RHS repeat-associated protein
VFSLLPRLVRLSAVFACGIVVLALVGAAPASADTWIVEGGTHYLKGGGGEVLKSWTAKEWRLWRKQVQALAECVGIAEECAARELSGETPLEDVPRATAEDAQKYIESARSLEGEYMIIRHDENLDRAGVDAKTLPAGLGFEAIRKAKFVPGFIGVELGNGLDQLYEVPEKRPFTGKIEEEEVERYRGEFHERVGSPTREPVKIIQCIDEHEFFEGECEHLSTVHEFPLGLYFLEWAPAGGARFGRIEEIESCEKGSIEKGTCVGPKLELIRVEGPEIPKGWERHEYLVGEDYTEGRHYRQYAVYETQEANECGAPPSGYMCRPIQIPAPGLITSGVEQQNKWSGLTARPEVWEPVLLPAKPPSRLIESALETVTEDEPEYFYGAFPERGREEEELEEKELETLGGSNAGEPERHGCRKGKPVNCATGDEYQTQTDLAVGGRGPALELALTYNSQLASSSHAAAGQFGYGWTGSYSAHLEVKSAWDEAIVHEDDGATVTFEEIFSGWQPNGGALVQAKLVDESGGYAYTLPDQTVMHFNSSGRLMSEVDRNGNTLTMSRNSEGRLEAIKDGAGRQITLKYNSEGQVESASDPMGHTVKYAYEGGNLASVTLPGETSPRWQFKYNSAHELTSETDGRGYATTTEYNATGQATSQTEPLGRTRKWSYTPTYTGSQTTITEPNGSETVEEFNEDESPTKVTRAVGTLLAATTTDRYDSHDEIVASTNPDEDTTEYGYDAAGDRTSETNPDGKETTWEYDSTHDITAITEPAGEKTTIERDSHGNAIKVSRPAPGEATQNTKYKYDADGDVESMTDALGHEWKYEYDSYGDRTAETDPEANKRTWSYNEDSQEISTVSPRGHVSGAKESSFKTTIERDAQGRPIKVTDPLGHETKYSYDADGDLASETDPEADKTTYTYDQDDEQTKIEQPNKATTETEYNIQGEVSAQIDGNKHATKYERNALGEITEEVNPLGQRTTKEYDEAGNLTTLTDAEKRTSTFKYDPASRLIEVTYSDGKTPTVKYEYNADGNRTKMTDGTGESTDTYDQLQRLTETKDGHGDTVKYEYNLDDSPTKITYPNGKAVTSAYDNDDRLKSVTDWLEHTTKYAYNPDSEVASITYPTGTSDEDTYAYEDDDAMSEAVMKKSTEILASLLYTRGKDDEITKATSKGLPGEEKPAFTYDENSRLTKGAGVKYAYDSANNPTTIGEDTYTYNSAAELEKSALKTTTVNTYSYNEVGQRIKTTPASGVATSYGYDQAGNLTMVTRAKEGTKPAIEDAYAYNGQGVRASETISGATSYLTWDTAEELPLLLNDGTNSYIYGPGGLPIEQISSGGTVTYLHHDQQGSTRLLTGSTGTVTGKCTYSAYGTPTCEGTTTTPLGYDGQYTSSDTGLIYMRARTYDPATAQFLTRDPFVALTGEPYSYAEDNPLNRADPSGRCGLVCIGGIALGVVAVGSGVGAVVVGAGVVGAALATTSAVAGAAATVADTTECAKGSAIGCVGAGVGVVASAGAGAVVLGFATGDVASAATAIGLTSGGIGLLSDTAGAIASVNRPEVSGCG